MSSELRYFCWVTQEISIRSQDFGFLLFYEKNFFGLSFTLTFRMLSTSVLSDFLMAYKSHIYEKQS